MKIARTICVAFPALASIMLTGCGSASPVEAAANHSDSAIVTAQPDNAANATLPPVESPAPAHRAAPLDLPAANGSVEVKPFPQEVTDYMVTRDGCDHFRGEDATDPERRAYLDQNIRQLCTGTDAKLAALRDEYADDPDVSAALSGYEDRIEAPAE